MWMVLLLFRWFCWVHSVSAGDSLLSPKGVNYEGRFGVLNSHIKQKEKEKESYLH